MISELRIRLKYPDVDTFCARFAINVSRAAVFLQSRTPLSVGTELRMEFLLSDGNVVLRAEGVVAKVRREGADPRRPPGMAVRFTQLNDEARALVDRMVALREEQTARATMPILTPLPPAIPELKPELKESAPPLPAPRDDLDGLAAEWSLTDERLAQTIARIRDEAIDVNALDELAQRP